MHGGREVVSPAAPLDEKKEPGLSDACMVTSSCSGAVHGARGGLASGGVGWEGWKGGA